MKPKYYTLAEDGKTPIPTNDLDEFADLYERGNERRVVGRNSRDGIVVSTVFLVLDHQFEDDGPPLLWETMVFGLEGDDEVQERYSSYEDAVAGHQRHVEQYL